MPVSLRMVLINVWHVHTLSRCGLGSAFSKPGCVCFASLWISNCRSDVRFCFCAAAGAAMDDFDVDPEDDMEDTNGTQLFTAVA